MIAVVLTENGRLECRSRDVPRPGPGECLVRIAATGVCNSDYFRAFEGGAYHHPLVMGHEISGRVVEAGPGTGRWAPGAPVVIFPLIPCRSCDGCAREEWIHCERYKYFGSRCDGGFQEYLVVNEWNLVRVPQGVDLTLASLCEPVAVAVHAADRLPADGAGENVLVLGGGFIGLVIAQILRHRPGYRSVCVIDRNREKRELAAQLGLEVMTLGEAAATGRRFGYVVEACGAIATFRASIELAAPKAQVVWIGNIQNPITFQKSEISSILRREIRIEGVWNSVYVGGAGDDWGRALEIIATSPWLSLLGIRRVGLADLPHELSAVYRGKKEGSSHGTIKTITVLDPEESGGARS
jgi:L-iditol 2-dehydrogenase